jgi:hypothetical protein
LSFLLEKALPFCVATNQRELIKFGISYAKSCIDFATNLSVSVVTPWPQLQLYKDKIEPDGLPACFHPERERK